MKKKAVVAMSGGVDSSVAAALLAAEGFETVGLTLSLFPDDPAGKVRCCGTGAAWRLARGVCDRLGLRHYVKNAAPVFGRAVMDDFRDAYREGRTPNPCVECNRAVKFSYLLDLAREMGADFLATGHYARIENGPSGFSLLRGLDPAKDQSYFLYPIAPRDLGRVLFPLGGLAKTRVRAEAARLGLPTAAARESHDVCFIPDGGVGRWLSRHGLKAEPGLIVDQSGRFLGRHRGYFNFTIGQRRGLGVSGGGRLYVTAIDPATRRVTLGPYEAACASSFEVSGLNWLRREPPAAGERLSVQVRYRHRPAACEVKPLGAGSLAVDLAAPEFAVAPGQSAVFYEGERVLGGGIIGGVKR